MWQWDNENGEFTEQAIRKQYWLSLIIGIIVTFIGVMFR